VKIAALIADLQRTNAGFRETWCLGEVRSSFSTTVAFDHPGIGELHLKMLQFDVREDPAIT